MRGLGLGVGDVLMMTLLGAKIGCTGKWSEFWLRLVSVWLCNVL